jgi:SAM-dependent methyltransferase
LATTIGSINEVTRKFFGGFLVKGWASGGEGEKIESIFAQLGDSFIHPVYSSLHEPNVGILDSDPSTSSGFTIRFSWLARFTGFATQLISIVPVLSSGEGEPMYWVIDSPISTPPKLLIDKIGGGGAMGFKSVGLNFLGHFIHKAGLSCDARVLDIGCGVGRMAYALAHYLAPDGVYRGFDVCQESIDWANGSIGKTHPNFAFQQIDLRHDLYNPEGTVAPLEFKFPYEDDSFDFVFLTSVFTHMSAPEIRAYLKEIRRVLMSGGTCLLTAFLMDEISTKLCKEGKSSQNFVHSWDEGFTVDPEQPENAVAFEEGLFLKWLEEAGFETRACFPGYWSGRLFGHNYQDMLVLGAP